MDLIKIIATDIKSQVQSAQTGTGNTGTLDSSVKGIIDFVIGFVAVLAVIAIIIGGVLMTTSQGDAAKVKKGRDAIIAGVIGLIVSLLAFLIIDFVLRAVQGNV